MHTESCPAPIKSASILDCTPGPGLCTGLHQTERHPVLWLADPSRPPSKSVQSLVTEQLWSSYVPSTATEPTQSGCLQPFTHQTPRPILES